MIGYWIEVISDGGYYWRICTHNGEIVCRSDIYFTLRGARRKAKRMHKATGLPWYDELRYVD